MSDTEAAAAALSKAIAALEAQRGILGDAITDAADIGLARENVNELGALGAQGILHAGTDLPVLDPHGIPFRHAAGHGSRSVLLVAMGL